MCSCQPIYLVMRRMGISTFLFVCMIIAGCSNSSQSALEEGALAQSQFESGQLAAARQTIARAVAERDDIAELQLLRGQIEMAAKSPSNAFDAYSNALSLDSANVEALLGVAQLGLQVGRIKESEDAANRLLTLDPRHTGALLIKGLHNIVQRKFEEALKDADAIMATQPTDEGAVILKARSLALLNRQDEAFAVVENARKASGDTAGIAITLLELHRLRGEGEEMVPMLERLRTITPGDRRLDIDEADTLYKLGDTARARGILRRAIEMKGLEDSDAEAIVRLWGEYDPQPLDAEALRQFAAKAGLPAREAVARYFIDRGEPGQAEAALVGAPANADIAAFRARIALAQRKFDEALAQANAILAKDATHCDALIAKAQVSIAKGRADDAVVASQTAAANCPQLPAAHLTLAHAHQLKRNTAGASLAFRHGFENNLQDSGFARTYAAWLEQTGQGSRAVAVARRLTTATPALLSGWQLYRDICAKAPELACTADAEAGMARAKTLFGVDLRTGERPPPGLLGRLARR